MALNVLKNKLGEILNPYIPRYEKRKPVVLFENASGVSDTIVLNDDITNYKYLEFYGYGIFNTSFCNKYNISDKKAITLSCVSTNNEQIRINAVHYSINTDNKTLKAINGMVYLFISRENQRVDQNTSELKVTKVLGYK